MIELNLNNCRQISGGEGVDPSSLPPDLRDIRILAPGIAEGLTQNSNGDWIPYVFNFDDNIDMGDFESDRSLN